MHILEQYAVNCGTKISKPFILKEYFPIPFEKYIVLHVGSETESKNYDYFNDVIDYIKPYLDSKDIKIVQIGGSNEKQIKHCYNALGTTKRQMAHIIDNSLLYFGNDTMSLHFASYFQKKIVCTSTVLYTSCFYPYWSNKNDYTIIESNRGGKKPTFSPQENPKTINFIKPEEIAGPILTYLGFDKFKLPKTVFIGDKYVYPVLECLPRQILPSNFFPNQMFNIRFDYQENIDDLQSTAQNLASRPCCLILDRPIQIELLQNFFGNIKLIIYDITKNINLDFIQKIHNLGLKHTFIFKKDKNNTEDLLKRKYELINFPNIIEELDNDHENIKDLPDLNNQNLVYKTTKILFDNNKFYSSRAAQIEDKPSNFMNGSLEIELKNISNKNNLLDDISYGSIYSVD